MTAHQYQGGDRIFIIQQMSRAATYYTKFVNWLYSSNCSNMFITRTIFVSLLN